jgi:hypothetical protein
MSPLFSETWMNALKEAWNNNPAVFEPLQKAGFTSRIGYGFKGEPRARGYITVVNGMVVQAGAMDDGELDWDLRASVEDWTKWIDTGFGLNKLGPAISTNALHFEKGNYRQMIKNLSLSQPFLQHFSLMQSVK